MLIDLPFVIHETVQTVALIYILTVLLKDFKMKDFDDSDVFLMLLVIVFCIFYMLAK